ncbi:MAG TPA: BrnT family toxin [Ensifer sp.]|nr:BrnT family toxin [Ensifer sp.]
MQVVWTEFSRFEWDEDKRISNIAKHGIDFPRAANALMQPHIEKSSDKHGEVRTLAVCSETGRLIAVVYTMRGDACRIISARAARKNEQKQYRQLLPG